MKNRGLAAVVIMAFAIWTGLLPLLPTWAWAEHCAREAQAAPPSAHLGVTAIQPDHDLDLEDDPPLEIVGRQSGRLDPPGLSLSSPPPFSQPGLTAPPQRPGVSRAPPAALS